MCPRRIAAGWTRTAPAESPTRALRRPRESNDMALRETAEHTVPELAQNQRKFLLAGAAGAVLSAIGYVTNAEQFFTSYLMAYMLVLGLTLGALAFSMIHQLSGGAWGVVSRQSLGAASRVLPFVTILFLPIILGMP